MLTVLSIESNAISLAICLMILLSIKSKSGTKREYHKMITMISMLMSTFVCYIFFNVFTTFKNDVALGFAELFYTVFEIVSISLPFAFFAFIYLQIFRKAKTPAVIIVSIPFLLNIVFILLNPINHGVFSIIGGNIIYGKLYAAFILCNSVYIVGTIFQLLCFGKIIGRERTRHLLSLFVPPAVGIVLQHFLGGANVVWSCTVISVLYYYINILREKVNFDYLSGLYNRMQADEYIDYKIKHAAKNHSFSGMMIDVDNFKFINDNFGHSEGDRAIEKVSQILKHTVAKNDFVARQGGDEFLLILETDDFDSLSKIASRLTIAFEKFNRNNKYPYDITISMGYDVYKAGCLITRKQFLRHIDELMYQNKRSKKMMNKTAAASN